MPGIIYRVIPKQVFLFKASYSQWISKGIDITQFREATLLVRSHNGNTLSSATFSVDVFSDGPTAEDGLEFMGSSSLTAPQGGPINITSSTADGALQSITIGSANLPSFLRVKVTYGASGSGQCVVSADIVAKS